jgi:hypothetical protein
VSGERPVVYYDAETYTVLAWYGSTEPPLLQTKSRAAAVALAGEEAVSEGESTLRFHLRFNADMLCADDSARRLALV